MLKCDRVSTAFDYYFIRATSVYAAKCSPWGEGRGLLPLITSRDFFRKFSASLAFASLFCCLTVSFITPLSNDSLYFVKSVFVPDLYTAHAKTINSIAAKCENVLIQSP